MTVAQIKTLWRLVTDHELADGKKVIVADWTNRNYISLRFMDNHNEIFKYDILPDGTYERTE